MSSVAKVKEKLRTGGVSWGSWLMLGSPAAAEIMAQAGFDWLIIEGEHAAAGMDNVQLMLQAMNGSDTVPMLRVPWNDKVAVKVALDIGVKGILFPMINSRQEAEEAVRACKYPPEGVRGIGFGRVNMYGQNIAEYLSTANEDLLIFVLIEHEQGVANADEILSVPGIDCVFFGFADYGASVGLTGQLAHPKVLEARSQVLAAARRHGVAAGFLASGPAAARDLAAQGFQVIGIGSDAGFVADSAKSILSAVR